MVVDLDSTTLRTPHHKKMTLALADAQSLAEACTCDTCATAATMEPSLSSSSSSSSSSSEEEEEEEEEGQQGQGLGTGVRERRPKQIKCGNNKCSKNFTNNKDMINHMLTVHCSRAQCLQVAEHATREACKDDSAAPRVAYVVNRATVHGKHNAEKVSLDSTCDS